MPAWALPSVLLLLEVIYLASSTGLDMDCGEVREICFTLNVHSIHCLCAAGRSSVCATAQQEQALELTEENVEVILDEVS